MSEELHKIYDKVLRAYRNLFDFEMKISRYETTPIQQELLDERIARLDELQKQRGAIPPPVWFPIEKAIGRYSLQKVLHRRRFQKNFNPQFMSDTTVTEIEKETMGEGRRLFDELDAAISEYNLLLTVDSRAGAETPSEIPEILLDKTEMKEYYKDYSPQSAKMIIESLPHAERKAEAQSKTLTVTILATEIGYELETVSRYLGAFKKAGFYELLGVKLPGR